MNEMSIALSCQKQNDDEEEKLNREQRREKEKFLTFARGIRVEISNTINISFNSIDKLTKIKSQRKNMASKHKLKEA